MELIEGEENSILADIDMPIFDNVKTYEVNHNDNGNKTVSMMAPGVYGSLTIRLTALSRAINHYRINPRVVFKYTDSLPVDLVNGIPTDKQTDENVIILEALSRGHILFFKNRVERSVDAQGKPLEAVEIDGTPCQVSDFTHNDKYVFYNPITDTNLLEGVLSFDDEINQGITEEVTLYWYWPFEYGNLSREIKDQIKLPDNNQELTGIENDAKRLKYFDRDKLKELADGKISFNETQLYDYADTRIGTFVEGIRLHLEVDGYHEADESE